MMSSRSLPIMSGSANRTLKLYTFMYIVTLTDCTQNSAKEYLEGIKMPISYQKLFEVREQKGIKTLICATRDFLRQLLTVL